MLTREFLRHIVCNPSSYRNILAVTFTNKATAEMKERILEGLNELATGGDPGHLEFLVKECGLTEKQARDNAAAALNNILHDFSGFSVSTIDSFFQKIFRAFMYELGIKFNFDLLLDNDEVISLAVKQLFYGLKENSQVTDWLLQFITSKISEEKSFRVENELAFKSREIFRERFFEYSGELFARTSDKVFMNGFAGELRHIVVPFIETLNSKGKIMSDYLAKVGITTDDLSQRSRGVGGFITRLTQYTDDTIDFSFNSYVTKAAESEEQWAVKSSPLREKIIGAAGSFLISELRNTIKYIEENKVNVYTAQLILRNIYITGLFSEIANEAKLYIQSKGYFLLSQIPQFLSEITKGDGASFVYEKTGNRYNHFMLDEFQDTSYLQYSNFSPLIENSLSQGYSNLVVGDVKQSIYRWRNSDWSILSDKIYNDFKRFRPETVVLAENYRSKPNIVTFNNAFFTAAPGAIARTMDNLAPAGVEAVTSVFKDTVQSLPEKKYSNNGYVNVDFLESADYYEKTLTGWLPETVFRWWNKGIRDIAVLVRENRHIPVIFNALYNFRSETGAHPCKDIKVVSGESLSLASSPVVNFLASLLKYTVNPADSVNNGVLLKEYKTCISKSTENPAESFKFVKKDITFAIPELDSAEFNAAMQLPLYEMAENFISVFNIFSIRSEIPYVLSFLDCVKDFIQENNSNVNLFLEWWEANAANHTVSMPDEKQSVKILSIHKSKGMQYEVVVIPFPLWALAPVNPFPVLLCRTDAPPFNKLPVIPLTYGSLMQKSIFSGEYNEELTRSVIDNLNLLYVATTRSKTVLEIAVHLNTGKTQKNISGLFEAVLNSEAEIIADGKNKTFNSLIRSENPGLTLGNIDEIFPEGGQEDSEAIEILTEISVGSGFPAIQVADTTMGIFEMCGEDKLRYGEMIHEILSGIRFKSDTHSALAGFFSREKLNTEEREMISGMIDKIFGIPGVDVWFAETNTVLNEVSVVSEGGKIRRPDRLVINNKEAVVIDYKTGRPEIETHRRQVNDYVLLLEQMGYSPVEGWLLYTDIMKTERVK